MNNSMQAPSIQKIVSDYITPVNNQKGASRLQQSLINLSKQRNQESSGLKEISISFQGTEHIARSGKRCCSIGYEHERQEIKQTVFRRQYRLPLIQNRFELSRNGNRLIKIVEQPSNVYNVIPELKLRKSKSTDRNPRKQLEMLEHFQERRRHDDSQPVHKYVQGFSQNTNEDRGKIDSGRQTSLQSKPVQQLLKQQPRQLSVSGNSVSQQTKQNTASAAQKDLKINSSHSTQNTQKPKSQNAKAMPVQQQPAVRMKVFEKQHVSANIDLDDIAFVSVDEEP